MPHRTSRSLDDEESIRGSHDDSAGEVCGHHEKLVGRPPVRLGLRGQGLPAVRLTALAANPRSETGSRDVADAPSRAQSTRGDRVRPCRRRRETRLCQAAPFRLRAARVPRPSAGKSRDYRCSSHISSSDRERDRGRSRQAGRNRSNPRASVGGVPPGPVAWIPTTCSGCAIPFGATEPRLSPIRLIGSPGPRPTATRAVRSGRARHSAVRRGSPPRGRCRGRTAPVNLTAA